MNLMMLDFEIFSPSSHSKKVSIFNKFYRQCPPHRRYFGGRRVINKWAVKPDGQKAKLRKWPDFFYSKTKIPGFEFCDKTQFANPGSGAIRKMVFLFLWTWKVLFWMMTEWITKWIPNGSPNGTDRTGTVLFGGMRSHRGGQCQLCRSHKPRQDHSQSAGR